jgi:hypothetical protein
VQFIPSEARDPYFRVDVPGADAPVSMHVRQLRWLETLSVG